MPTMESIKDAVENAKAQATLESAINTLTTEVKRLSVTVEKNNEKLERLSVLETNHSNTSSALGRAFDQIEELRKDLDDLHTSNGEEHRGYDRYIWMCFGFAGAVSVMWSVVGYRMNAMIDKTLEATARMEQHMQADKVQSESDVRALITRPAP